MNCVICNRPLILTPTHNAEPLAKGRCCSDCNEKVISARLDHNEEKKTEFQSVVDSAFRILCDRHLKDGPDGIEVKEYNEYTDEEIREMTPTSDQQSFENAHWIAAIQCDRILSALNDIPSEVTPQNLKVLSELTSDLNLLWARHHKALTSITNGE